MCKGAGWERKLLGVILNVMRIDPGRPPPGPHHLYGITSVYPHLNGRGSQTKVAAVRSVSGRDWGEVGRGWRKGVVF